MVAWLRIFGWLIVVAGALAALQFWPTGSRYGVSDEVRMMSMAFALSMFIGSIISGLVLHAVARILELAEASSPLVEKMSPKIHVIERTVTAKDKI